MMQFGGYCRPSTLTEALSLCSQGEAIPFAGGTDLMVKARSRSQYRDKTIVDIGGLAELAGIRDEGGRLCVGAAVTLTELLNSRTVRNAAPLLWQAVSRTANRQVRNRATLAGNVANACPASDCIPALMVLGASVTAQGPEGRREIPLRELLRSCEACLRHAGMRVRTCFFLETATKKLTLRPGELIVSVAIPRQHTEERSLFYKLTENQSAGMAVLNFAMAGALGSDGRITAFRVCPGGVFPRPRCFPEGENPVIGQLPERVRFAEAAREIAEAMGSEEHTLADYGYKSRVLPEIIQDGMAQIFCGIPMEE